MSAEAAGEGSRSHDAHLKTKALVAISQNPLIAEIKPTTELTALRQTESRDSFAVTPLADIIDRSVQTPVATIYGTTFIVLVHAHWVMLRGATRCVSHCWPWVGVCSGRLRKVLPWLTNSPASESEAR